jgi:dolichol-phosphate mannosyltransferase
MAELAESARRELSLVIPAFNEEAAIEHAVIEAHAALTGLGYTFEILIVNDGSTDRTARIVTEVAAHFPSLTLLQHPANRGYGAALETGFRAAKYSLVAFTDADSQFYLDDLDFLVALTNQAPIVVGRRIDRKDPWRRRFFSWGYNLLIRALLGTGVRDCDCALKVFRKEVLESLMPRSTGFFVNAEMLCRARRLGYEIAEVGVRHRARRYGESKVSLKEIPRTLTKIFPFWWAHVVKADRNPAAKRTTKNII